LKKLAAIAVVVGILGLATTFVLWVLPSEEFIFAPGSAKPLADKVQVEDARPADPGDVYYVDVFVRRTSLLEDFFPFTRPEGSTVVPEHALLPPGTSEAERDRQTAAEMQRSEEIASFVALRELGYEPDVTPLGALVTGVFADTPAIGKLEAGDVIVAVDGDEVLTPQALRAAIGTRAPGEPVRLTVTRDDAKVDVTVRTIPSPSDPEQPIVGVQVDQEADIELPIDVDIDLGSVGGPSAGLPFALEIARLLGRDVTGGCRVAATGELALDGSVLPVGGLEQKTIGARRTDVDVFVVPEGENADEARAHADGLQVLPVESFQQALRELQTADLKC
jgi:PDZ domain-containing protein